MSASISCNEFHPTAEELTQFLDGEPLRNFEEIETHILSCETCCRVLGALENSETNSLDNASPHSPLIADLQHLHTAWASVNTSNDDTDLSAAPSSLVGVRQIAGYEVLEEIGRGGMGVVFRANHLGLNRFVALKMILHGGLATPEQLARFRVEAEITARVHHPNIVEIYEIGEQDGIPYFALEWLDGGSLTDRIQKKPLSLRESISLMVTLAKAVHAAHSQGVLHRDLKPDNILFTANEDGSLTPKIADFGLARPVEATDRFTMTGDVFGTVEYMSPEQAKGQSHQVGVGADIYTLGVIFYELLSGQRPFQSVSPRETLNQIIADDPPSLRSHRRNIPRDLEAICERCLQKNPEQRFATALELAEELQRYQQGRPLMTRRSSLGERFWKWIKRHPMTSLFLVTIFTVLVLGISGVSLAYSLVLEKQQQAQQSASKAREEANNYRAALADSQHLLAEAAWKDEDSSTALDHLRRIPHDLRHSAWRLARQRAEGSLFTLYGHEASVLAVAVSPDGQLIASGGRDRTIRLWNARTGELQAAFEANSMRVDTLSFNHTGDWIAASCSSSPTRIWDRRSGQHLRTLPPAHYLTFHPHLNQLALCTKGMIQVYDCETGALQFSWQTPASYLRAIRFTPDGSKLLSTGNDGVTRLWQLTTDAPEHNPTLLQSFSDKGNEVLAMDISPDGLRLATGGKDTTVKVWNLLSGKIEAVIRSHRNKVFAVRFSPEGQRLASGSMDKTIQIHDLTSLDLNKRHTLVGHQSTIMSLAFTPDGQRIVSGSHDKTVRLWETRADYHPWTLKPSPLGLKVMALHPTGSRLALVTEPKKKRIRGGRYIHEPFSAKLIVQNLHAPDKPPLVLDHFAKYLYSARFSNNGQLLAVSTNEGVKVLHADKLTPHKSFQQKPSIYGKVLFSPDDQKLVSIGSKSIVCWEVHSGQELFCINKPFQINDAAWSPNGKYLASCGRSQEIEFWNATTGEKLKSIRTPAQTVNNVVFDPTGRRIVSDSGTTTIQVWDVTSGKQACVLQCKDRTVGDLAFSPDGKELASGSASGEINFWNLRTQQRILRLQQHQDTIRGLEFGPDGSLFSLSRDDSVKRWRVFTHKDEQTLKLPFSISCIATNEARGLFAVSDLHKVQLRDKRTLKQLTEIEMRPSMIVYGLAISNDGKKLCITGLNKEANAATGKPRNVGFVQIWSIPNKQLLHEMEQGTELLHNPMFNSNDELVGFVHSSKLWLWDTQQDKLFFAPLSDANSGQWSFDQTNPTEFSTRSRSHRSSWSVDRSLSSRRNQAKLLRKVKHAELDFSFEYLKQQGTSKELFHFRNTLYLIDTNVSDAMQRYRNKVTQLDKNWHSRESQRHLRKGRIFSSLRHSRWCAPSK